MVLATRSLRGARRLFAGLGLLALVGSALPALAAHPDEGPGPLPWRVGGRVGFTVDAAMVPDSAGRALEVYVRIPPATLAALTVDSLSTGRLRLITRLRSGYSGRTVEQTHEFEIAPADSARDFGHVVMLRYPAHPGPQKLGVRLEDQRSRKRGLIYTGRKVVESGHVEGEFPITVPKHGPELSDLEFVWPGEGARSGSFRHGGREVVPNPERLYGLHANDLHAWFSARDSGDTRPWHWTARVLDSAGQVVASRDSTESTPGPLDAEVTFDLVHERAGGYQLEVRAGRDGDPQPAVRTARFSIAWESDSWFRNPRDVEDAVHLLLQPDDEDAFFRMQPGEQEQVLDEFWRRRDPTPGTALNEALETFRSRVAIANHTYGILKLTPGMLTDMGRTFIRYGEPSEILKQVIPSGDNTLTQALADIQQNEDRPVGDVEKKGLVGDMRPFEVWIYEGDIAPPVDADPNDQRAHRKRLVFLFVDEQGLGEYTLRYSTE